MSKQRKQLSEFSDPSERAELNTGTGNGTKICATRPEDKMEGSSGIELVKRQTRFPSVKVRTPLSYCN